MMHLYDAPRLTWYELELIFWQRLPRINLPPANMNIKRDRIKAIIEKGDLGKKLRETFGFTKANCNFLKIRMRRREGCRCAL